MENEIERKFMIQEMPNLKGIQPIHYERYFLQRGDSIEERIQRKGDLFEREKKITISPVESRKKKEIISEAEFNSLKVLAPASLIRDSYLLPIEPEVSIKIYGGAYTGLVRAEVEFRTLEEAKSFIPFKWMGKEITDSPLGRDSALLDLKQEDFRMLLEELS